MRGHVLLLGLPGVGKSTLAHMLTVGPRGRGRKVAVLDPAGTGGWEPYADHLTQDPDEWLAWVTGGTNLEAVVDDAYAVRARLPDLGIFAVTCAHQGHRLYLAAHLATSIEPHARIACEHAFIFNQPNDEGYKLFKHYGAPELRELADLPDFHGYWIRRGFKGVQRFTVPRP